jgi:hypothetical protein
MNREEIIRMARVAGFERLGHTNEDWVCYPEDIETFAFLVAFAEREACAKVCEDYGRAEEMQAIGNDYAEAIRARGQT